MNHRSPGYGPGEDNQTPLRCYIIKVIKGLLKLIPLFDYMSGPGPGKIKLGKADVYLHVKGKSGATITHVDIELPELNEIIKPGENTYVGGKKGGVFLGLKKEMIERAEKRAKKA